MIQGSESSAEWVRLCNIEPSLITLFKEAKEEGLILKSLFDNNLHSFVNKYKVYGRYKAKIGTLAGWHAEKEELRTTSAYDVAYHAIFESSGLIRVLNDFAQRFEDHLHNQERRSGDDCNNEITLLDEFQWEESDHDYRRIEKTEE